MGSPGGRGQRTEDETTLYRPTPGKKIAGFSRVWPGLSGLLAGKNVGRVWSSLVESGRVDSSLVGQGRGLMDEWISGLMVRLASAAGKKLSGKMWKDAERRGKKPRGYGLRNPHKR